MAKSLPKAKFLQGIFEPLPFESNINDCTIIGEIPQELNGSLYKIGPNPQYIYSANYHMYQGDGMVHKIQFNNGLVSYSNRWVRTNKFNEEREAHQAIYAGFRDKEAFLAQIKSGKVADTVNTNVVYHAEKLLILNEGSTPYRVDGELNTIGKYDFNSMLTTSMTAHPRICSKTQQLILFSYLSRDINGKTISYYMVDKSGDIIHQANIEVPYKCMMHDFAITQDYVVFPLFPLTLNFSRLFNGEDLYQWDPKLGCYFGIMHRNGTSDDVIWFHQPEADLAIHIVSAYQEDNLVILDGCCAHDIPEGANGFDPENEQVYPTYLTRWVFDLNAKQIISKTKLNDVACEFPRIDERYTGLKYNHVYTTLDFTPSIDRLEFNAIGHYNLQDYTHQVHDFGRECYCLEPIFVPRHEDSPEGDGFLLTYVYNKIIDKSDLVILDALNVDKEPIAIIQLPFRVPFTFHGCWVSK